MQALKATPDIIKEIDRRRQCDKILGAHDQLDLMYAGCVFQIGIMAPKFGMPENPTNKENWNDYLKTIIAKDSNATVKGLQFNMPPALQSILADGSFNEYIDNKALARDFRNALYSYYATYFSSSLLWVNLYVEFLCRFAIATKHISELMAIWYKMVRDGQLQESRIRLEAAMIEHIALHKLSKDFRSSAI